MNAKNDMEFEPEERQCDECGSARLRRDAARGETVCGRCGLVLEEQAIDPGAEWRAFDADQREKRQRTGAPMTVLLHDKGLATDIGWSNKDVHGKQLSRRNRSLMYRLRKWQRHARVNNSAERSLAQALVELDRLASRAGLPRSVRETAAVIHRRAAARQLLRGRSIEAVMAASIYAACRQCGVPRTLGEIAEAGHTGRRELARTYRALARELRLGIAPASPESYLPRFAGTLKLPAPVPAAAAQLLRDARAVGFDNGKSPMGMAASALYIAARLQGHARTQKEVADVAGVTEVTVRNRYQELRQVLGLAVNVPRGRIMPAPPAGASVVGETLASA